MNFLQINLYLNCNQIKYMRLEVNREWVKDYLNEKKKKYGSEVKEERINFLFLKNGSMVYPYNYFDDYIEAMIDAVEQGEDIDELIALVFPETIDHPIVKKKLLNMINND